MPVLEICLNGCPLTLVPRAPKYEKRHFLFKTPKHPFGSLKVNTKPGEVHLYSKEEILEYERRKL